MAKCGIVAACVLLACLSLAHARMLRQVASVSDYTNSNNTYVTSTTVISAGATAATADACITLCAADDLCTYWSWCPDTETAGCTVPGVNGGANTTVVATGCVLSYDETEDRTAVFSLSGDAVAFSGGFWNPSNMVPPSTNTTATTGPDPANPITLIDPSGTPAECNGWFSGDQWSGDEIECHVCDSQYQLKCDLDTDLIGDDSVKCEFDMAGVASLTNNAVEFECTVDFTKTPQNQCDWVGLGTSMPACAVEPVRRIMATWKPDE